MAFEQGRPQRVARTGRFRKNLFLKVYINFAVEAKADYIVSRDNDLLDLMTGHTKECKEFRQRFRLLKVVDPLEFLKIATPSKEK